MKTLVEHKAPYFKMNAATGDGEQLKEVSLDDYEGKWLVMFFYPLDFTDVWPTELRAYSGRIDEFEKMDAEVLAVSTDSEHSHKAWIDGSLGEMNYPMAADMMGNVSSDYGVLLRDEGIALRGLFIINPEGVVKYSVVHDLDVGRSVDETLRVLAALQTGGICPVDWQPGDPTL